MKHQELKDYFALMETFHSRRISAVQFEKGYMALFKADQRLFPEAIFNVLNQLFSDVDAFVADPVIRRQNDLDEQQLLACSRGAYEKLMELVETG